MKKKKTQPAQDSDFDGPWKATAEDDFPLLMHTFYPRHDKLVDWRVDPLFEDKELTQIIGKPDQRNKFVDLLVKVRFLDGSDRWIWLHIEFQTDYRKEFDERTFYHNCGLVYLHKGPVITLVVRGDLAKKWKPSEYVYKCEDFEHRIKFPTCKLSEKLEKDWVGNTSLPVIVARAQIEAVRTTSDPQARFAAKRDLVRELYDNGYSVTEFRRIFRLVDWMMHLRDDLEQQFNQFLEDTEKAMATTFLSCIEKDAYIEGESEGKKEGKKEGRAELVLAQLSAKFGKALTAPTKKRIGQLSSRQLDKLGVAILDFEKIGDLKDWLEANG